MNIKIEGLNSLRRRINEIEERADNLQPFFEREVSPQLTEEIEYRFEVEGPDWPELSPYTIAVREFPNMPILQQTQRLLQDATTARIEEITNRSYTTSIVNPYMWRHELGDPDNNVPQRAFFWPSVYTVLPKVLPTVGRYILQGK